MQTEMDRDTRKTWSLRDVVDFEFFTSELASDASGKKEQEIRHWFQTFCARKAISPDMNQPHPGVLMAWLQDQRKAMPDELPSPGQAWQGLMQGLTFLVLALGLLAGGTVTSGLLRYDGAQAISVAMLLGVLVILQLAWSVVSWILLAGKGARVFPMRAGLSGSLLRASLHGASTRLHRHLLSRVSGEQRMHWETFWQRLSQGLGSVTPCFTWPILSRMQSLGVAFNLGAIMTFFTSVVFRDLAFGWQTSMQQVSNQRVADWVQWMSLPWNWIWGSGEGFPALEHIEGSRMILKDGIMGMQHPDLTAWWPFLLLSLLVYGLLPRTLLWVWTLWMSRRCLAAYPSESDACRRLWDAFQTPWLHTDGPPPDGPAPRKDTNPAMVSDKTGRNDAKHGDAHAVHPCRVMMDAELLETLDTEDLKTRLEACGWAVQGVTDMAALSAGDPGSVSWNDPDTTCLLWVQEAWQPPIREIMEQLQRYRQSLPSHVLLVIGLIGKPDSTTWLTPALGRDLDIWTRFVRDKLPQGTRVKSMLASS